MTAALINKLKSKFWLRLFFLKKMPLGFFSRMYIQKLEDDICEVNLPFGWVNLNPFGSMYFGSQTIAGEFSTGVLVLKAISMSGDQYSMLLSRMNSTFMKRGLNLATFRCEKPLSEITQVLEKSKLTGEGQTFDLVSRGFDSDGEQISEFVFTWSIKFKSKKQ